MTEPYPFSTTLKVRFNETDAQGHVNFAQYLNLFDVALIEYLRAIGFSYTRMLKEDFDMLYVDAHASYHAPAYFDDLLRIHCRAGKVGRSSARFDFQVFNESKENRLTAKGEITVVTADRKSLQKTRVPESFRQALEKQG
ncbi:MAG: thioesterase family protein [Anaerolineales bacterium]|nr:MAG: thioesterase family protein [Anaerolineales bacterium]